MVNVKKGNIMGDSKTKRQTKKKRESERERERESIGY